MLGGKTKIGMKHSKSNASNMISLWILKRSHDPLNSIARLYETEIIYADEDYFHKAVPSPTQNQYFHGNTSSVSPVFPFASWVNFKGNYPMLLQLAL